MTQYDINKGDRYVFLHGSASGTFTVEDASDEAAVALLSLEDGKTKRITALDLAILQAQGGAVRTAREGQPIQTLTASDYRAIQEPPGEYLSAKQERDWLNLQKDFKRASTLLFYVREFDKHPGLVTTEGPLSNFILSKASSAKAAGFEWTPSTSAVRKALAKGGPGNRSLALLLRRTNSARLRQKWPPSIYDLGQETVRYFWSNENVKHIDAHSYFDDRFYLIRDQERQRMREESGSDDSDPVFDFEPPCHQTISNWINSAKCHATVRSKYGVRQANRELRGRGESMDAIAPLEIIVLDQTLGDIWACEEVQADGTTAIVLKRPWIVWAMDLFSRSVAGFNITFEPPCIATFMMCLREVISPKADLVRRFGEAKGAADVWGKFSCVVLDNAMAHIGVTVQVVGDLAGFEVDYAPLRTPEYKPWVERLVGTMNTALHGLPGGIPGSPEKLRETGLDPRKTAMLNLHEIKSLMDHKVVEYHLEVHSGIGMAPARKWSEGLLEHGRPTVDDARAFKMVLGRYETRTLTAEGILFDGHDFHDQVLTSTLLNDLARFHKSRKGRKLGQSASFRVHFFYYDGDCSSIFVLNEFTKEVVELPNADEFYRESPVSFAFAKGERENQARLNQQFHTREEKAAARRAFKRELEESLATSSHRQGQRTIRVLHGGEKPQLAPGDQIVDILAKPSISGMPKAVEIPSRMPLVERVDDVVAPPGRKVAQKKRKTRPKGAPSALVANDALKHEALPSAMPPADQGRSRSEAELDELAKRYGFS